MQENVMLTCVLACNASARGTNRGRRKPKHTYVDRRQAAVKRTSIALPAVRRECKTNFYLLSPTRIFFILRGTYAMNLYSIDLWKSEARRSNGYKVACQFGRFVKFA